MRLRAWLHEARPASDEHCDQAGNHGRYEDSRIRRPGSHRPLEQDGAGGLGVLERRDGVVLGAELTLNPAIQRVMPRRVPFKPQNVTA